MPDNDQHPQLPEKLDLRSLDVAELRQHELLRLFPEIRTEGGKLDLDRLKLALGQAVDAGRERFGMNWPGKADCFKTIQTPSMATLRPCPEESVNWDTTENVIIEGDNLEVLKLLQKSYLGKVKMIYIDPPYNTGNDFIYPDNYSESLQTYMEYTEQVDAEGKRFGTNPESDGRFHTKWLNMMYPRLYLARNMLREDGVIFVSIDDNESDNLMKLCNEVFGEENFIARIAVQVNPRGRHLDQYVAQTHEYVIAFAKDAANSTTMYGLDKEGRMVDEYDKEDATGRYRELGLRNRNQAFNPKTRPNLFYPLYVNPADGTVSLDKSREHSEEVLPVTSDGVETCWTWGKDKVAVEGSILVARQIEDGTWRVSRKDYLESSDGSVATTLPKSLWPDKEFNNDYGRRALQELFGESVLDFPKPPELLKRLIKLGSLPGDIILDFFAGSGTTAHASLELDGENVRPRHFVLVQLPEPTGRKDFPTIAEITRERVRRLLKKLDAEESTVLPGTGANQGDRGFRAFRLDESSFQAWDTNSSKDGATLEQQMQLHIQHIREKRTDSDLLFEILLKSGFPLTTPVETLALSDKTIYSVASGALILCLERALTMEIIRAIAERKPERVVCLDAGFAGNDQLKTNAVQIFKTKGIGSFKTV